MISALIFAAVLLLVGVVMRLRFAVFQRLFIPASVIAGMVGLLVVQSLATAGDAASPVVTFTQELAATLRSWPGFLIAVVFSGMLLERKPAPFKESISRVGRQGLMVWVIVLGETAVGLLATWWLIKPFYDVPNSIGMLIETGFAGGHGTAAAMGQVFEHPTINLQSGLDLGILMATTGLVYGLVSGIAWINLAVRFGWIRKPSGLAVGQATTTDPDAQSSRPMTPIGYARVRNETIDPLLLQIIWLTLAFGVGLALQAAVTQLVGLVEAWISVDPVSTDGEKQVFAERLTLESIAASFPLFIYTLFGGLIVRRGLQSIGYDHAIDRETINRLTSTAMDILVVAAITTLNLSAVATLIVPFSILFFCGIIWTGFCLFVLARWILPAQHWFQLGLINYGMSTGTTATGFVLLRLVDPELESGAAEDYALAAPLSSPFIGGGMVTIALPLLVLERLPLAGVTLGLFATVTLLVVIGRRWNRSANASVRNTPSRLES
ncbi:MAG: sodium/glutamate symporter [Rubripirellula sp.]